MGLSFPNKFSTKSIPFMDNAINSHLLKHNIFSIFLAEDTSRTNSNIHFGNIDKLYMQSNFTFVNVVSDTYWEIDITDIMVGNEKTNICDELRSNTGRCGVAIDSGTSLYAGPTE